MKKNYYFAATEGVNYRFVRYYYYDEVNPCFPFAFHGDS